MRKIFLLLLILYAPFSFADICTDNGFIDGSTGGKLNDVKIYQSGTTFSILKALYDSSAYQCIWATQGNYTASTTQSFYCSDFSNPTTATCSLVPNASCPNGTTNYKCNLPSASLPECQIGQWPWSSNCQYSNGIFDHCTDGTTSFLTPCGTSWLDQYKTPASGQSYLCFNGQQSPAGQSCFSAYLDDLLSNDPKALDSIKFVGFGTGTLPTISAIGPIIVRAADGGLDVVMPMRSLQNAAPNGSTTPSLSSWLPTIKDFNITIRGNNYSSTKLLDSFIKNAVDTTFPSEVAARATQAGYGLSFNPATRLFTQTATSNISETILQPAQVNDLIFAMAANNPSLLSSTYSTPLQLPLSDISQYVHPDQFPWAGSGLNALQTDFQRVFSPSGSLPAINFPDVNPTSSKIGYSPNINRPSIATFSPSVTAPSYIPNTQTSSVLPNPITNSNPTTTDGLTSPPASPPPGTPINPTAGDVIPPIPDIYPDTWKFFDFLKTVNPFNFDVNDMVPSLPSLGCSYEIHETFHVPFLGTKHFDMAPCVPLQPLRTVLAWVFSIIAIWSCFYIVFGMRD